MARQGLSNVPQLAREARLSLDVVHSLVHGEGTPEDDTIASVAAALDLSLPTAYELAGFPSAHAKEYRPPAEANRLSERQRLAIDELIRAAVPDLPRTKRTRLSAIRAAAQPNGQGSLTAERRSAGERRWSGDDDESDHPGNAPHPGQDETIPTGAIRRGAAKDAPPTP